MWRKEGDRLCLMQMNWLLWTQTILPSSTRTSKAEDRATAKEAEALKEATVTKTEAREEKKQERPSLKERLAQKKDIVAKNEATREPRQMNKDRGQALV